MVFSFKQPHVEHLGILQQNTGKCFQTNFFQWEFVENRSPLLGSKLKIRMNSKSNHSKFFDFLIVSFTKESVRLFFPLQTTYCYVRKIHLIHQSLNQINSVDRLNKFNNWSKYLHKVGLWFQNHFNRTALLHLRQSPSQLVWISHVLFNLRNFRWSR
jgi:hypothetical protein